MVNINKKYLDENLKNSAWLIFKKEIKSAESEKDFKSIISRFLTPTEQLMLEKRLAILYLLKQKLSYRKIGEILDVTRNTIIFVKNGFLKKKKVKSKIHWRNPSFDNLAYKNSPSKFPTYKGKGRWRFLNT